MDFLSDVKLILGLPDSSQDEKLDTIIRITKSRLCALIEAKACPSELEYIVIEVAVRRFNRIGSEGMKTHEVEGETIAFRDNDFSDYMDDISAWKKSHSSVGRIRFL